MKNKEQIKKEEKLKKDLADISLAVCRALDDLVGNVIDDSFNFSIILYNDDIATLSGNDHQENAIEALKKVINNYENDALKVEKMVISKHKTTH